MRPLSILDLLTASTLLAMHLAIVKLCIDQRESGVQFLALAFPLVLTAIAHRRLKLHWKMATAIHFPIGIIWSICFGLTTYIYFARIPPGWYERGSTAMYVAWQNTISTTMAMAIVGIFTGAIYGLISHYVHHQSLRSPNCRARP